MESLNFNSQERELHQLKQMQENPKESCMVSFQLLHSHLKDLSNNDSKGTCIRGGFERAFATLFEQDVQNFTRTMLLNLDQLEKHLFKEEFQELESFSAFRVLLQQFQTFLYSRFSFDNDEGLMIRKSGKDTHAEDADINSVNDKQRMAEVQLTAEHNILTNEQQHYEQSESIYDTYLLEKVDRNTTPDSTDMSHRGGEIDQNAVKCQVSCPLLDPSFDNMTTEFSNQSLESENISLKKTVAQLQKDFSRMEAHCVNMELKYQNQALKDGQHGKILNETSNKAKIKREIEVLETINIEFEHSVAKLFAENKKESVLAKPHHVIAPGSSRNSQEESYGSNDMAHNHYLEEARKKTQERNRNSKSSVMHTTSLQNTTNDSTQKPRSNNQTSRTFPVSKSSGVTSNSVPLVDLSRNSSSFSDSKHFVCSTCQKCVFNANHDAYLTKFLKEISKGYRISLNNSSAVHEKPNTPRSCLRWKPTGRIFKTAGLRWIPIGKMLTKVDNEPPNGSNEDTINPYECKQTLNVSASTFNLSACTSVDPKKERLG
ncbi:hypothetical protein Tco_1273676, partial [Tanacetum coccineum]